MQAMLKFWQAKLDALHRQLASLFKRSEPRERSLAYLKDLLCSMERKNSWPSRWARQHRTACSTCSSVRPGTLMRHGTSCVASGSLLNPKVEVNPVAGV